MTRNSKQLALWTLLAACAALWPTEALAGKKVVRLLLDGPIAEAPSPDAAFGEMMGERRYNLRRLLDTINKAADDKEVAGIALILEDPQVKLAQVEELTRSLAAFRAKGKKVLAYMDSGGNLSYALACAADHITLDEAGSLGIIGLNAQLSFYKGMFDKIGVQADMLHVGAYKSALEPFTRTEPSPEAAENVNWLLDGIFNRWVELIAAGRKLPADKVKAAIDAAPIDARPAYDMKLVDAAASFNDFRKLVHKEFGSDVEIVKRYGDRDRLELDLENPFALFEQIQKLMQPKEDSGKPAIALIYVDGAITTGRTPQDLFGGSGTVGSTTVRAALETARQDDNVKAVVLRVDSPGGSALASDIMWVAATRLAKEKPLIVSMGGVAGSGGYYVSLPGDTVLAEASTLTGSIGVVGGKLVWKDLWVDKLGVTTTEFPRGKHSALMSMNRPWTQDERNWMQNWMNTIFDQFKGRVMASRGNKLKGDFDKMAGGRVFTGEQALKLGLIDQIGGLSDAFAIAAKKANLTKYDVLTLPKPDDFSTIIARLMGQDLPDDFELGGKPGGGPKAALDLLGGATDPLAARLLPLLREAAPADLQRIAAGLRNALILNREHVGMFMPFELNLR